jgi:hypothetical protein
VHGGCHCGSVRWTIRCLRRTCVWVCNCSVCNMKQNHHIVVNDDNFFLEQCEDDALTTYTFGTHAAQVSAYTRIHVSMSTHAHMYTNMHTHFHLRVSFLILTSCSLTLESTPHTPSTAFARRAACNPSTSLAPTPTVLELPCIALMMRTRGYCALRKPALMARTGSRRTREAQAARSRPSPRRKRKSRGNILPQTTFFIKSLLLMCFIFEVFIFA